LDAIIQFDSLPFDVILQVVDKFVMELENQLADRNVHIEVMPEAREWLGQHGFDPSMGARPMKRVIQQHIKRKLADELLFGQLGERGGTVRVDVDESGDGLSLTTLEAENVVVPG
ncbi:MAG: ATP-dependent Clp protease ATP-binding subunit ClpA, partial [Wenzhouxiangellaceae bacterium]